MFLKHPKLGNRFLKEFVFAIILFALPFLILVHNLFSYEVSSRFQVLGYTFQNGYPSDNGLVWYVSFMIIPLAYVFVFFSSTKRLFKFALIPTASYLLHDLIADLVSQIEQIQHRFALSLLLSMSIILLLFGNKLFRNFKPTNLFLYNLKKDLWYVTTLVLILLSMFCYKFVPSGYMELSIGMVKIDNYGFPDVRTFVWILSIKITLIMLSLLWFFSVKRWWKYALLSPILITFYQLRNMFDTETDIIDEHEILNALPLLTLVALVLIALSKNVKDQYVAEAIYEKTSHKLEMMVNRRNQKREDAITETRQQLMELKSIKSPKELNRLVALKKQLESELAKK